MSFTLWISPCRQIRVVNDTNITKGYGTANSVLADWLSVHCDDLYERGCGFLSTTAVPNCYSTYKMERKNS